MILPDTSIWVPFLRRGESDLRLHLIRLLRRDQVAVCGPVLAEVIAGTDPAQREATKGVFEGLAWAALGRDGWMAVGEAAGDLRKAGLTVPLTDVAISVAATQADAEIWTTDSDFERIREVLPRLRLYQTAG